MLHLFIILLTRYIALEFHFNRAATAAATVMKIVICQCERVCCYNNYFYHMIYELFNCCI